MITGINHITFAVSDLDGSFRFYVDLLGCRPVARWPQGAYLLAGDSWLALNVNKSDRSELLPEGTHVAFDVPPEDFTAMVERLREAGVAEWRENRSEGASLYFLDLDGHKLELHVGTLATRLGALTEYDDPEVTIYAGSASSLPATDIPAPRHQDFPDTPLHRRDLDSDPIAQFAEWLDAAIRTERGDPYAMTLATSGADGVPSARIVVLKAVDGRGFIFTSQYDGPKGRELGANPCAALVFYWPEQGRQVRVTGVVERLPDSESVRYFYERPRESQLALHAFPQNEPIGDRAELDGRFAALVNDYKGRPVPLAEWGGYVVQPKQIEFWQGRSNRLHDRFQYRRSSEDAWIIERLTP